MSRIKGSEGRPGKARLRKPRESEEAYQKRITKLERERLRKRRKNLAKADEAEAAAQVKTDAEPSVPAQALEPNVDEAVPVDPVALVKARLSADRARAAKIQAQLRSLYKAQGPARPATAEVNFPSSLRDLVSSKAENSSKLMEGLEIKGESAPHAGVVEGGAPPPKGGSAPPSPSILAGSFQPKVLELKDKVDKTLPGQTTSNNLSPPAVSPLCDENHNNVTVLCLPEANFSPQPRLVPDLQPRDGIELCEQWLLLRWVNQARVICSDRLALCYGASESRRLRLCYAVAERDCLAGESAAELLVSRLGYVCERFAIRYPNVTIDELLTAAMMLTGRPIRWVRLDPAIVARRFASVVVDQVNRGLLGIFETPLEARHG